MTRPRVPLALTDTLFRIAFSGIFLVAAYNHYAHPEVIVGRLEAAPLASLGTAFLPAGVLVHLTGVVLALGGMALLLGVSTRVAALVLAAVLVPITVTVHVGNPGHLGPLAKNVALLGGLLHFATRGAGGWSLDGLWRPARVRAAGAAVAGALVLVSLGLVAAPSRAAPPSPRTATPVIEQGAVFLVQAPAQLPVVLKTARELLDQGTAEAHVVVCGKAVPALAKDEALAPAVDGGVRVVACGLTLKKLGLDPSALPEGVSAVPNGLIEVLRLQAKGLLSVEL